MAKEQAVRVNLSTQANEILATMREEMPKAYYYFRKNFGGKQKTLKHEDQMLDKALEDEEDQFTDIDYWISKVGNRWMTYTQAEYFPKAKYANAFHYSFIYYETMASCGAFFPLYSTKQAKGGKAKKEAKPDGVILYTDHFFYQMSERTKIEYRSKELIKKFVSTRLENALTVDENGDAIVKFKGGHGFGKQYSGNPRYIAIRTFLRDEELNAKQRKACEPVDTMYELVKDGTYIKDVALNTALLQDPKDVIKDNAKKLEAFQKLGMGDAITMYTVVFMAYMRMLEDILHMEINEKQSIIVSCVVAENSVEFIKKWEPIVKNPDKSKEPELIQDIIDVCCKCAKQMKLKNVNRDTITHRIEEIIKESLDKQKNNN